jgi:dihydrofolate synthase/folylpolyglutamate synthase
VDELDVADEPPTYFEILTTLAFLVFAREGVDVMVVETGLGGSFDATNVVSPMAAIITNIGMEHTYFLGDTIKEIAAAKAGIIKPDVPVVTAASGEALRVIRTRARKMRSAVRVLGRDFRMVRTRGGELAFRSPALNLDRIHLGAIGRHQAANAACALMALSLVGKKFKGLLGKRTLREALLSTRPEARVELVRRDPMVIIDSAHTTASAAALADALEDLDPRPEGTRVLVFAAMADKDVKGILKLLVGSFDAFVFTRAPSPRAAAPGKLAGIFRKISRKPAWSAGKPEAARRRALKLAGQDGLVTVAGSFYLAGMLRGSW